MVAIKAGTTAAEFLAMPETNQPVQLLGGEVIMTPAPTIRHQLLAARAFEAIRRVAEGGTTLFSPVDVRLDEANVVQPDVMWVAPESACQPVEDRYWQGAPDLVVEVLSPATARADRGVKFALYEQHGAREYWLVDPAAEYIEVWRRAGDRLERQGVYGPGESFVSAVLGEKTIEGDAIFSAEA